MKKALLLVLILPVVAMANNTAIKSGGLSSLSYQIGTVPDTIPIEWVATFTDVNIWAIGSTVTMNSNASAITIASKTMHPILAAWGTLNTPAAVGQNLATLNHWGGIEGAANIALYYQPGTVTLTTATLSGFAALPVGTYHIYNADPFDGGVGGDAGYYVPDATGEPTPFTTSTSLRLDIWEEVVPEPATMLLLAGALPFLRRRTA